MGKTDIEMLSLLSENLSGRTFRSDGDELAFGRQDVPIVADTASANGMAILGSEVWLIDKDDKITTLIPNSVGSTSIHHRLLDPDEPQNGESWAQFCNQSAQHTKDVVNRMTFDNDFPPKLKSRLRINLTLATERNFKSS